jgi:hypothetical protein
MVECATKVRQVSVKDISEKDISIMRSVLDKIWQNLGVELDVGCATADNNTIAAESTGKNSSNIFPTSTTTTTSIPTALTSTKKRKNKN